MTGVVQQKIKAEADQHVHIMAEVPDKPSIALDINNQTGRRSMSVRVEGMTVGSHLLDVTDLPASHSGEDNIQRFCPYCGKEQSLVSSRLHECGEGPHYGDLSLRQRLRAQYIRRGDPEPTDQELDAEILLAIEELNG